eukprot:m51a1_g11810 putative ccr4-not transcription complex (1703) ;mRNA; f:357512-363584
MSDDDTDEGDMCPMCLEPLDATEKNFKPCQCGYQMCRFCWNHIMEELGARCPACRTPYDSSNFTFVPLKKEEKHKKEKREREAKQKKPSTKKQAEIDSRKHLADVRVVQRNLIYVTNISLGFLREEGGDNAVALLRKSEYFGQYGRIVKLVVNKSTLYNANSPAGPTVSCYVTYARREDAASCITAVNGAWLDSKLLRASYGTTKYCTFFLRGMACTNPECLYLHEQGVERDSFTKESMAAGKNLFSDTVQPRIAYADRKNVLPPPGLRPRAPVTISYDRAAQESPPPPIGAVSPDGYEVHVTPPNIVTYFMCGAPPVMNLLPSPSVTTPSPPCASASAPVPRRAALTHSSPNPLGSAVGLPPTASWATTACAQHQQATAAAAAGGSRSRSTSPPEFVPLAQIPLPTKKHKDQRQSQQAAPVKSQKARSKKEKIAVAEEPQQARLHRQQQQQQQGSTHRAVPARIDSPSTVSSQDESSAPASSSHRSPLDSGTDDYGGNFSDDERSEEEEEEDAERKRLARLSFAEPKEPAQKPQPQPQPEPQQQQQQQGETMELFLPRSDGISQPQQEIVVAPTEKVVPAPAVPTCQIRHAPLDDSHDSDTGDGMENMGQYNPWASSISFVDMLLQDDSTPQPQPQPVPQPQPQQQIPLMPTPMHLQMQVQMQQQAEQQPATPMQLPSAVGEMPTVLGEGLQTLRAMLPGVNISFDPAPPQEPQPQQQPPSWNQWSLPPAFPTIVPQQIQQPVYTQIPQSFQSPYGHAPAPVFAPAAASAAVAAAVADTSAFRGQGVEAPAPYRPPGMSFLYAQQSPPQQQQQPQFAPAEEEPRAHEYRLPPAGLPSFSPADSLPFFHPLMDMFQHAEPRTSETSASSVVQPPPAEAEHKAESKEPESSPRHADKKAKAKDESQDKAAAQPTAPQKKAKAEEAPQAKKGKDAKKSHAPKTPPDPIRQDPQLAQATLPLDSKKASPVFCSPNAKKQADPAPQPLPASTSQGRGAQATHKHSPQPHKSGEAHAHAAPARTPSPLQLVEQQEAKEEGRAPPPSRSPSPASREHPPGEKKGKGKKLSVQPPKAAAAEQGPEKETSGRKDKEGRPEKAQEERKQSQKSDDKGAEKALSVPAPSPAASPAQQQKKTPSPARQSPSNKSAKEAAKEERKQAEQQQQQQQQHANDAPIKAEDAAPQARAPDKAEKAHEKKKLSVQPPAKQAKPAEPASPAGKKPAATQPPKPQSSDSKAATAQKPEAAQKAAAPADAPKSEQAAKGEASKKSRKQHEQQPAEPKPARTPSPAPQPQPQPPSEAVAASSTSSSPQEQQKPSEPQPQTPQLDPEDDDDVRPPVDLPPLPQNDDLSSIPELARLFRRGERKRLALPILSALLGTQAGADNEHDQLSAQHLGLDPQPPSEAVAASSTSSSPQEQQKPSEPQPQTPQLDPEDDDDVRPPVDLPPLPQNDDLSSIPELARLFRRGERKRLALPILSALLGTQAGADNEHDQLSAQHLGLDVEALIGGGPLDVTSMVAIAESLPESLHSLSDLLLAQAKSAATSALSPHDAHSGAGHGASGHDESYLMQQQATLMLAQAAVAAAAAGSSGDGAAGDSRRHDSFDIFADLIDEDGEPLSLERAALGLLDVVEDVSALHNLPKAVSDIFASAGAFDLKTPSPPPTGPRTMEVEELEREVETAHREAKELETKLREVQARNSMLDGDRN